MDPKQFNHSDRRHQGYSNRSANERRECLYSNQSARSHRAYEQQTEEHYYHRDERLDAQRHSYDRDPVQYRGQQCESTAERAGRTAVARDDGLGSRPEQHNIVRNASRSTFIFSPIWYGRAGDELTRRPHDDDGHYAFYIGSVSPYVPWCYTCQRRFPSPEELKLHMQSNQHKTKVERYCSLRSGKQADNSQQLRIERTSSGSEADSAKPAAHSSYTTESDHFGETDEEQSSTGSSKPTDESPPADDYNKDSDGHNPDNPLALCGKKVETENDHRYVDDLICIDDNSESFPAASAENTAQCTVEVQHAEACKTTMAISKEAVGMKADVPYAHDLIYREWDNESFLTTHAENEAQCVMEDKRPASCDRDKHEKMATTSEETKGMNAGACTEHDLIRFDSDNESTPTTSDDDDSQYVHAPPL